MSRSTPRPRSSPPRRSPARCSRGSCRRRSRLRQAPRWAVAARRAAEGRRHRVGVVGLLRPRLGIARRAARRGAGAPRPPRPGDCRRRLGRCSDHSGRLRHAARPAGARRCIASRRAPRAPPRPSPSRLSPSPRAIARASLSPAALRARAEQRARRLDEAERFGLDAASAAQGRAPRPKPRGVGRQNRAGRTKANSSKQIERGERAGAEPPRGRARMAQERRRRFRALGRFAERDDVDLAVRRQPRRLSEARDQRRRIRQADARRGRSARGFGERHENAYRRFAANCRCRSHLSGAPRLR